MFGWWGNRMINTLYKLFKNSFTISNGITVARIAMIPSLINAMRLNNWGVASMIFSIAAISDIADGFLARLLNQQSVLGAILDPLADKLLLASCYVTFIYYPNTFFALPDWFYAAVFGKEIILLGGAAYMLIYYSIEIKPTTLGKIAMLLQSIFVGGLLVSAYFDYRMPQEVSFLAVVVVICMIAALIEYIDIATKQVGG